MIKRSFKLALLPAVAFFMVFGTGLQAQTLDEARTSTKNEQYDKADALFQQLIQKDPANSVIYFHYGENTLLNYFADTISNSLTVATKEAAEIFNKGVTANPAEPLNYVGLAKVASLNGDKAKAEELRLKAKELLPPYKKVKKIDDPKAYAYT
ncbi:MAG: tetratricopeptide repeat protein, partial [Bacteroidales bacterium]